MDVCVLVIAVAITGGVAVAVEVRVWIIAIDQTIAVIVDLIADLESTREDSWLGVIAVRVIFDERARVAADLLSL
jgi:hypothetical protein